MIMVYMIYYMVLLTVIGRLRSEVKEVQAKAKAKGKDETSWGAEAEAEAEAEAGGE
jgi:hypothetical protein